MFEISEISMICTLIIKSNIIIGENYLVLAVLVLCIYSHLYGRLKFIFYPPFFFFFYFYSPGATSNEPYLIDNIFLHQSSIIFNPAKVGVIQLEGLNMNTKSTVTRER